MLSTRRANQATNMGQQDAHDDFFQVQPWSEVCTKYENLRAAGSSFVWETFLSLEDQQTFGELYAREYQAEITRLTRARQAAPLIRQQALQRFPTLQEEPSAHEQDLWCEIFATLTTELLALRRQEDLTTLDEESWATIAFGCLSPMASMLLREAEAEEQAMLAREAKEIEARLAQREAEKRRLKPQQEVWIEVNQGCRPAKVLAVVGQKALLEYVMPKGSTALRLVQADDPEALIRSVSYHQVPLLFLRVLAETRVEWIGEPQAGRPIGSPAACLQKRTHSSSLSGHMWQSVPERPRKFLFNLDDLAGGSPILPNGVEDTSGLPSFAQENLTWEEIRRVATSKGQSDEYPPK